MYRDGLQPCCDDIGMTYDIHIGMILSVLYTYIYMYISVCVCTAFPYLSYRNQDAGGLG